MGFKTELSISNDAWDHIEKNPDEFLEGIMQHGMMGEPHLGSDPRHPFGLQFGVGSHSNPVTIHDTHHADVPRLYLANRGMFTNLSVISLDDVSDSHLALLEQQLKTARQHTRFLSEQIKKAKEIRSRAS